ncbi:MAG: 16S rRNA (guanine(527)-N(7))-methyltransferase RsmG [Hyphomonadaceae bacterium]
MTGERYGKDDLVRDLALTPAQAERLETHRALLAEWSQRMNLVGPKELEAYWRRHALDCGQLVRLAPGARRWADLGSGAGFPGLIIAALIADLPGAQVDLVESTGKKAAFLREAARAMGAPARVFQQRIEDFGAGDGAYDVVTARALAPLPRLTLYAKPILDRGAQGLFLKGAELDAELAAAGLRDGGAYKADVMESASDPRGSVLRLTRR